jgi:hypothetical protein
MKFCHAAISLFVLTSSTSSSTALRGDVEDENIIRSGKYLASHDFSTGSTSSTSHAVLRGATTASMLSTIQNNHGRLSPPLHPLLLKNMLDGTNLKRCDPTTTATTSTNTATDPDVGILLVSSSPSSCSPNEHCVNRSLFDLEDMNHNRDNDQMEDGLCIPNAMFEQYYHHDHLNAPATQTTTATTTTNIHVNVR